MIINGKEVEIDFRRAESIQNKIDTIAQIPETAKVEVSKSDLKDLQIFSSDTYNNYDGFGISNNVLLTGKNAKENRKDYYTTFQEMSETNFIHRGLQIIADDCTQKNQLGHVIDVFSNDDEIKEILENLFNKRLNLDKELWSIVYETCKRGDNFYEIIPDDYKKPTMIARMRYLEPERVNRIEKNGKLAFYTYTADTTDPEDILFRNTSKTSKKKDEEKVIYKLEPWQIIHFKITDKDFHPYGGSLLKAGVKCFRRLQLLEDGMVIYRLARVPERRVFEIDCGNLPQNEANKHVQRIKDNYRSTQILDDKGNINRTSSALSLTQDIFVPTREGSGTKISSLPAGTGLQNIDDIRYFRDQILWTMNIPPEYLGFTSDQSGGSQGRGSLAMQDIKFSRFAERIQFYIEEALVKIASIELFFKRKRKDDLENFRIELTPPSNIKELMSIEFLSQKMNLLSAMNGLNIFPRKYLLKNIMKMSDKEIDNINFYKDAENEANNQQTNGMLGGMDLGMSGGMDLGAAPAEQPAPASSVATEENFLRLFGKDVLIENKEDFLKVIKALDEYEAEKNKPEVIKEELPEIDSEIISEMKKIFNKMVTLTTNDTSSALIIENELGGLNFEENSFSIFNKPTKKPGPKKGIGLVFEEQTRKFDY